MTRGFKDREKKSEQVSARAKLRIYNNYFWSRATTYFFPQEK